METMSNKGNGIIIKNKTNTLLRYPGGKSRAVKKICRFIPKNITRLCSPFFGGGAIELSCAETGIEIVGYDSFGPLVNFWQCVVFDSNRLADIVEEYYPLEKEKFYELQRTQHKYTSKYERAAIFYVLNRASFSGSTLSGGMSPEHKRFTNSSIERLRKFNVKNIKIKQMDFTKSIPLHKNDFLYLDPPYMIKNNLYGIKGSTHKGFRHDLLVKLLKKKYNWILSYNNCPEILDMYNDYSILYPEWIYGMPSSINKKSNEVLIFSNDISDYNKIKIE